MTRVRAARALWRHFPYDDFDTGRFVAATVAFHQTFAFDLVKITPRSSFCLRDYGARDEFRGDPLGRPHYLDAVVTHPIDWCRLAPRDPRRGFLGQQLDCVAGIAAALGRRTPIVQTIFSPVTQAKYLCRLPQLEAQWRSARSELLHGLAVLAESTLRFVEAIAPFVDGIFYVVGEAGEPALEELVYSTRMRAIDNEILRLRPFTANVLHAHGAVRNLRPFADYPIATLHWDESASAIPLEEGKRFFPGQVSGGLDWPLDGWPSDAELLRRCAEVSERVGPERLLLGSACVIPFASHAESIHAFVRA